MGDKVRYVGPFNPKVMHFGQPDQPCGFVRFSSLIERAEMNFNAYRPQRGKTKRRSHAVEDLALETFNINLDDCGDSMACGNNGVGPVLSHRDGGSSSTVREMVARGGASGGHRQPRLAIFVRQSPGNHLPRGASGAASTSSLDYCDAIRSGLEGDDLTGGPDSRGEQLAVEADVRPHIPDTVAGTNAGEHRRPEALLVAPAVPSKRQSVYQGTLHTGMLTELRAGSNGGTRRDQSIHHWSLSLPGRDRKELRFEIKVLKRTDWPYGMSRANDHKLLRPILLRSCLLK